MRTAVAIAIAGAIGTLARYGLDALVSRRVAGAFPWGTFVVNLSGAFVLGFTATLASEYVTVAPWLRAAVTVGLLGAYTTFSTLSFQTYGLIERGALGLAVANGFGSLAAGLAAVYVGVAAARAF